MIFSIFTLLALSSLAAAHGDPSQAAMAGPHEDYWYNVLPGDGGTQVRRIECSI